MRFSSLSRSSFSAALKIRTGELKIKGDDIQMNELWDKYSWAIAITIASLLMGISDRLDTVIEQNKKIIEQNDKMLMSQ